MRTPAEPITARARVRGGCVSAAAIARCMRRLQTFAIDFRGVVRVRSFGCGRRFGSAGAGVFCSLQNSYHETLTVERRGFAETRFDLPSDAGAPDGAEYGVPFDYRDRRKTGLFEEASGALHVRRAGAGRRSRSPRSQERCFARLCSVYRLPANSGIPPFEMVITHDEKNTNAARSRVAPVPLGGRCTQPPSEGRFLAGFAKVQAEI